ncbi:MAG: DEAD/DEAH box helicase, partial [Candidatus Electrothrix sp. AUS3]|nr:DEAD/DEAH box helicase [Candidatus Electrothrix gigas]
MKFTEFGFKSALVAAIKTCGYSAPTDIQQQAIPHLVQGRDLLGLAQTGTGKTAAFVLPTLQRLTKKIKKILEAKKSYEVFLTRENDVSISLEERTAIANTKEADL